MLGLQLIGLGFQRPRKKEDQQSESNSNGHQAERMSCDHLRAIVLIAVRVRLRNARHHTLATPLPPDVVALATKSGFRPQRRTSLRRMRVC